MSRTFLATWTCGVCGESFGDEVPDPPVGESLESEHECPSCGNQFTAEVTTTFAKDPETGGNP